MRKLAYLIGVSLLLGASAFGQEERTTTDVTLSYSYIRANPATRNSPDFNVHGYSGGCPEPAKLVRYHRQFRGLSHG